MRTWTTYDVAIAGGSTAAVAAAVAASRAGARVFLAADRLYLGEDLCDTLRLALPDGRQPQTLLAEAIFDGGRRTTPLRVKKLLDASLVDAGVDFEFGCLFVGARRRGARWALELVSRVGRREVEAATVIDATSRASLTRAAGAEGRPWPSEAVEFERTVILPDADTEHGGRAEIRRFALDLPDGSFRSMARAEQAGRDRTYVEGQLLAAGTLFFVPPDPILGRASTGASACGSNAAPYRPAKLEGFYILSGCADLPREKAAELMQPTGLMAVGETIGALAAAESRAAAPADGACEPREAAYAPIDASGLPTLGRYDVIVCGGGTSGAAAAIAAARRGASVLLIEYQHALGGVGTLGLIGRPWHGHKRGFAAETPFPDDEHNIEHKMHWLRRQLLDAGGEIWLGAVGCGARTQAADGAPPRVDGVVVAAPGAYGVVECDVAVDGTGSADLAAAAGCPCVFGAAEDGLLALQGVGLPTRPLGADYQNTDYLLVDERRPADVRRAVVGARMTMDDGVFDAGPLIQSRERRRIVGEHVLTYLDQIAGRTYDDSIVYSGSDYDSHGYPVETYFALIPHDAASRAANHPAPGGFCPTPYRCLIPRGVEGLLVTGAAISMKRDASAMVRMQFDLLNQGYAAGVAAAMAAAEQVGVRDIDVPALQRELVDLGALPAEVMEQKENFPLPDAVVARACADVVADDRDLACRALAIVLSHAPAAMDELARRFDASRGADRLTYAKILGCLGDGRGLDELIDALEGAAWDDKILQGRMAEYAHLPTPVDALVLALGTIGDPRALPALLAKLDQLDADVTLSHHRSMALALEAMGRPEAAAPLAELLNRPGMRGHQMTEIEPLFDKPVEKRRREGSLRELICARALLRCGDCDGLGRAVCRAYADDLRSLLADHAKAVLAGSAAMDA